MKKQTYTRQYLGVTITAENYREILEKEGRSGINFHTKHLKAYLKGNDKFRHGFMRNEEGKPVKDNWGYPLYNQFDVQSKLTLI